MNVQLRAGIKSPLGSLKHTAPVGKESSAEDGRMLTCFQCFFPIIFPVPPPQSTAHLNTFSSVEKAQ